MKKSVKEKRKNHLIWLDWPYDAFRLKPIDFKLYKSLAGESEVAFVTSERSFLRKLASATHVVTWQFKKEWFEKAPCLKALATPAAGRELMPLDEEMPKGVEKIHGTFHGQIMSETIIACMFAHARGLYAAKRFQDENVLWARGEMSPFCSRVAGTRAVILGYGNIGRATAAKLEALGVEVNGVGRKNIGELSKLLKTANWFILALPGDKTTEKTVNAKTLSLLPRDAVIINVGRGSVIDEDALADALRKRKISAAFLDVFAKEPLEKTSPLAENLPGLVRFPHVSAFAPEYLPLFFEELSTKGFFS